jgi:cell division protein FtsB
MKDASPDRPAPAPKEREPRASRRLTADEQRRRRSRLITLAVWAGFGVLFINGIVGESGYLATIRAEREHAALAAEVARLRYQNQELRERRIRLEKDPSALEEAARRQGMIRDGETVVTIRDRVPPAADTPAR